MSPNAKRPARRPGGKPEAAASIDVPGPLAEQERIRESEAGYRAVFEQATDAIFVVDEQGRFLDANPRGCEVLGYEREELLRLSLRDTALAGDLAVRPLRMAELLQGRALVSERPVRRKDGSVFTAEISARGIEDGRIVTILRDVTERRHADDALRLSEARSRALFEHASDAIFISDAGTHQYEEVNSHACEMLGYAREELLGLTVPQVNDPQDLAAHPLRMADLAKGEVVRGMRRLLRKDGTIVIAAVGARQLPDGRIMTIARDVTEREQANAALRLSEARSRALFEHASDGIFVAEGKSLAFVEVNRSGCEMLGYTREELLGMTVLQLIEPHDLAAQPVQVNELEQSGPIYRRRPVVRKDGSVFVAEMVARILPDGRFVAVARDVTEREHADQALRESEAKFRMLVEGASDGITITDSDWRFLEANPRFCEMVGYGPGELLRMSVQDMAVEEDMAREPLHAAALAQGRRILTERRIRRKDGGLITAEISARRLPDGTTLSVVRDITERLLAEKALRESEERLRSVFESDMMGIVFGVPGGVVSEANDYFLRLLGYTRDDLLAGRVRGDTLMSPESAPVVEEALRQISATGATRPAEAEFVRKDGSRVPVLTGAALIGSSELAAGFALDLTELRLTKRLLERAQALAHIGTWDADLATMTATFSSELLRIHGMPPGARSVTYAEFVASVHPGDRAAVERSIRLATEQPGQQRFEHRIVRPDGSVRLVEATSESVLDAAGRPVRIIGSVQDVTERRLLELQLREAQRLEAIGRLAGGVAHDFNNLLTIILGFSETLLDGLAQEDERRASAEQIRAAGRRAADLTQQLLAFGRRQVLRTQVFDLNVVLEEMRDILQRLVGEQVEVALSPDARPCLVRADRGQIEQVILNLSLNARDAMPDGGRLGITTRHAGPDADAQAKPAGRGLLLSVSDTGIGMSPEVKARIFEPFFTTKQVGQGTGLGLASVHGIVTQTGGSIEVTSAPGEGTTFRVFLPRASDEAGREEPESAPEPPESRGEETVLLVEDENAVRGFIVQALGRRGYRVIEAADGDQAIDLAHRHPGTIHLLVTDLVMPGMTGRELARYLTHERPGLRVLFISGYSDQRAESRGGDGAPEAFLQKPFTAVVLARQVRKVLDDPGPGRGQAPGPSRG